MRKCIRRIGCFWVILSVGLTVSINAQRFKFRLYLKDKAGSPYTLERPQDFLSAEALIRRQLQRKPYTDSDLPLSPLYLDSLTGKGCTLVTGSKWLNTVVVETTDSLSIDQLQRFSFVDSVRCVWVGDDAPVTFAGEVRGSSRLVPEQKKLSSPYGYAQRQIKLHRGDRLHQIGLRGKGMRVAVIDAGFLNVDRMAVFDSLRIGGTFNFVSPGQSVFEGEDHGTNVLSCLAADLPGIMIGSAPDACYWLLKSEDSRSEYPVEEDYWIAAVEYADSVGVDVISSSLGYYSFDNNELGYEKNALDGQTALISRAAVMAADKGILLFCSAGNEGNNKAWGKIVFPADAPCIVTVGAISEDRQRSVFSSTGYTSDCRIKPDVVSLGSECCTIGAAGGVNYMDGTSFATPVLAGLAVCLWQAFPGLSNQDMIRLLQQSADRYDTPDAETGFGVPDVYKAYKKSRNFLNQHN